MRWGFARAALVAALTASFVGCDPNPAVDFTGKSCASDADCGPLTCVAGSCGVGVAPDAGLDGGLDAGLDAGTDAGMDAGNAGELDAGQDAGPDAGGCPGDPNYQTSLDNCGGCGLVCAVANGIAACVDGGCQVAACDAGFAHCVLTGHDCETNLTDDADHCGSCATACEVSGATPACVDAGCVFGACLTGFADCSSDAGCTTDIQNDPANCGGCNNQCSQLMPHAAVSCMSATCLQGACNAGYANCAGGNTGCATDTQTDVANCGGCGQACVFANAGAQCVGGVCVQTSCDPGWLDCAAQSDAGCTTPSSRDTCGACSQACGIAQACVIDAGAAQGSCVTEPLCWPGRGFPAYQDHFFLVPSATGSPVVADFNGDGLADVVVPRANSMGAGGPAGPIQDILFGQPDGTLQQQLLPQVSGGWAAQAVIAADISGDGVLDLLFTNVPPYAVPSGQFLEVMLGSPDSGFASPTSYALPSGMIPASLAAFGPPGGAVLGVVVGSNDGSGGGATGLLSFFTTSAGGTLVDAGWSPINGQVQALVSGDFNADGIGDFAFAAPTFMTGVNPALWVELGQASGGFTAQSISRSGEIIPAIPQEWLATDGKQLFWNTALGSDPLVQATLLAGTIASTTLALSGSGSWVGCLTADFNGDGLADLVTGDVVAGEAHLLLAQSDGGYLRTDVPAGYRPAETAAFPSRPGALPDLVVVDGQSALVALLHNDGHGALSGAAELELMANAGEAILAGGLLARDLNGDGLADVAVTWGNDAGQPGQLAIYTGLGDGTFATPPDVHNLGEGPTAVVALDYNGDGRPDLAVLSPGSDLLSVFPGIPGSGVGFGVPLTFDAGASAISLIEMPGQGTRSGLGVLYSDCTFAAFANNDAGGFTPLTPVAFNTQGGLLTCAPSFASGDFNRDGIPDVALTALYNFAYGWVQVYVGTTQGGFYLQNTSQGPVLFDPTIAVGDMNGDQNPDLVLVGGSGGPLEILTFLGSGDGNFPDAGRLSQTDWVPDGVSLSPLQLLDVNGDGALDAVASYPGWFNVVFGDGRGNLGAQSDYSYAAGTIAFSLADVDGDGQPDLVTLVPPVDGDVHDLGLRVFLSNACY